MAKPTPGPWTLDRGLNLSNGASVLLRAGPIGICEVWKTEDRIHRFEQDQTAEANARLIAAAPVLLDACRAVVTWAETPGNHGGNPWAKPFVQAARDAIAQAEGR